jgi:hypothetical protein
MTVSNVTPSQSVLVGDTITILGSNFDDTCTVTVGPEPAQIVGNINPSQIQATVPNVAAGDRYVQVQKGGETAGRTINVIDTPVTPTGNQFKSKRQYFNKGII